MKFGQYEPQQSETEEDPGEREEMFATCSQDQGPDYEHEYKHEQEEGGETPLPWGQRGESFGGTEGEHEVEQRQPAKTPAEDAGGWEHGENEDDKQERQFPADLFQERAAVDEETAEQGCWCDETARQFGCAMRL